MSDKHVVYTEDAPEPIGPYSQAIRVGNLVFVSGQGSMNRAAGHMIRDSVEAETRQVLTNLKTILEAAGSSLDRVVKTTCFLGNMDDFPRFNAVYAEFFSANRPARSTIQAARLPGGIMVEVECIATVD
jgi:2-iminobutanoate/2-iminopropanoate deaminase